MLHALMLDIQRARHRRMGTRVPSAVAHMTVRLTRGDASWSRCRYSGGKLSQLSVW